MSARDVVKPMDTKRALFATAIVAVAGIGCSTSPSARQGYGAIPADASNLDADPAVALEGSDAGSFADVVAPGTDCARQLEVGKLAISNSR